MNVAEVGEAVVVGTLTAGYGGKLTKVFAQNISKPAEAAWDTGINLHLLPAAVLPSPVITGMLPQFTYNVADWLTALDDWLEEQTGDELYGPATTKWESPPQGCVECPATLVVGSAPNAGPPGAFGTPVSKDPTGTVTVGDVEPDLNAMEAM